MSIEVRFYTGYSKKINSTKQPANTDTFTKFDCTLKEGCNILNPEIEIYLSSGDPSGYNYAYIPSFGRYYFVSDWTYFHGTWTASLSVDVLASFKTSIGTMTKYVSRCSSTQDLDLMDSLYPTKANADLSYVFSDNPFRVNPFGSFIVGIIGAKQTNVPNIGGINYYLFDYLQMAQFVTFLMSNSMSTVIQDPSAGLSDAVVKAMVNPLDYIESCIWFPFNIPGVTTAPKVQPQIGWWTGLAPITDGHGNPTGLTPLGGGVFDSLKFVPGGSWSNSLTIPDHPQYSRGHYLNYEPYSKYVFHLDPWGDIPIDAQTTLPKGKTITYTINCEGLSGMGTIELYAGGYFLARQTAQVGVSISIAQVITDFSKMISNEAVVGGAVAGAGGIKTGWEKFKDAFKDWFSLKTWKHAEGQKKFKALGEDVVSGVTSYANNLSSTGVSGSLISYVYSSVAMNPGTLYTNGAYIKIVRFSLVDEDRLERGRPYCKLVQLNSIPGYIECAEGDNEIAALDQEKDEISSYLTGGFFYE